VSGRLFDAWQSALQAEPPRDLGDLRTKLAAIPNTEAADELQPIMRWFEDANAMHALSEDQDTRALADEINEARKLIASAEKLIGQADELINDTKPENYSKQAKKTQLGKQIERAQVDINSRREKVGSAAPQGVSESVAKIIDEVVSDLQRTHGNLERRALKLGKA
jgi:chromosome segregation ATPase